MSDQHPGYMPPPNFAPPPPQTVTAPAPYAPAAAPAAPGPYPSRTVTAPAPYAVPALAPAANPTPWRSQGAPAPAAPAPAPQGYGQPAPQGYGQPAPQGYGQPAPQGYGQPVPQGYGQPVPQGYGPPQGPMPGQQGNLTGLAGANSSAGGSYLSFKTPGQKSPDGRVLSSGEAGFHEVAVKRIAYEQSRDPDKHGAWMFIVETQVISSNVHQPGESRSVVYNMNHQPSAGNVKDFVFALLGSMGYGPDQVAKMISSPGQSGGSQFDDVVRWVYGSENPAGRAGARLLVESTWHVTKTRKVEMTVHRFTPRPPQQAPQEA